MHLCYEVICVLEGEMKVSVDLCEYTLTEGDSLIIFPNQLHSISSKKSRHMLCIFSPSLVQAYSTKTDGRVPESAIFRPSEYLVNTLDLLNGDEKSFYKKGVLYSLLSEFDKDAVYIPRHSGSNGLLYDIFAFVEKNFDKDCSLSALSKNTGYDYAYLSRYFKKMTGSSFIDHLTLFRLGKACELLVDTDMSVLDCALSSGYSSLRSFNRSFKHHFSVTPMQYRAKSRSE